MGWINRIRNVFGMGDSQDPGRRPASTHSRPGEAATPRKPKARRKSSGHHPPAIKNAPAPGMSPEELHQAAVAHHKQKHWEKALAFWQQLQATAPLHAEDTQLGLVICLLALGREAEARSYYTAPDAPAPVRLEAAHFFLERQDYEQALPLWRTLAAEKDAAEMHAPAWRMRCLLELGQEQEAKFLYDAPDAALEELSVAANYLQGTSQWEAALKVWRRFGRGTPAEQADGLAGQVRCLLELDRRGEAEALYSAAAAAPEGRLAAAEFYEEHDRFAEALPLYRGVAGTGATVRNSARRGEALCLLNLGEDRAAAELLATADIPLEALRAAAVFYHEREEWELALGLDRRIAERSEEDRAAAEGFQVTCLLNLGKEAEARKLYDGPQARPQCRRAAAEFLAGRDRHAEALVLWEQLAEHPDYHRVAVKNRVYTLLQLERETEAEALFAGPQAELPALLGAANFFFNLRRFERALPLWREVAERDRSLGDAVAGKIVTCLMELGQESEARRLYEAEGAATEALLAAAEFWMMPDEGAPGSPSDIRTPTTYREALKLWDRLLTQPGEHRVGALRGRLTCLLALERFDEGMQLVRAPDAHRTLLLDATLFFCLSQRWLQALPLLEEVIARDAELADRSRAFQVTGLLSLDRHQQAAQLYDNPEASPAVILAAADFFRERGQWDTALSLFRRMKIKNSDGDPAGLAHEIDCLLWLGRDSEAQAAIAGSHPPRQALVAAGNFYLETERWSEALAIWQKLDRGDVPFRAQAQAHIAGCLLRLGRKDEAQALYQAGDAAPEVVYTAWSICSYLQDWTEVLAIAERRKEERRPALKLAARNWRMRALIRLERMAEARPEYTAADLPAAGLSTAGYDLMQVRQWADALVVWQEAQRRFPQRNQHARAQTVYCLLALGRESEARAIYDPADAAPAVLTAAASFFDARRQYEPAAALHLRLIAAEPGANPLLGYYKNRVAAGDWETLSGDLSDRLLRELDPSCRRHDVNAFRQALWLPLVRGRFDEVLAKSLAIERRLTGGWRLVRCHELQLIAAALAGARKPFERAVRKYREESEGLDDIVTIPDVVRQLAARYGVLLDSAMDGRLAELTAEGGDR